MLTVLIGDKWWENDPGKAYISDYHLDILNINKNDIKWIGHDHDVNYYFTVPEDYEIYNHMKKSIYIIMPDGRIRSKLYPWGTEYDYLPNY